MPTDNSTTKKARKGSTRKAKPADELKPYRQDSEKILAMLFDDDSTPDFIRDLLDEMLSELESATQVFWNRREIAAVALPLMLQEADRQGIDFFAARSEIFNTAAHGLANRHDSAAARPSEYDNLQDELEADAAAIMRILHSPRVPEVIKRDLGDRVCELKLHPTDNPAVFRVAYPLAVREWLNEEKAEAEGSVGDA